jgi:hypothetical protein
MASVHCGGMPACINVMPKAASWCNQGSMAQPRGKVVTIGGCEHVRKGILRFEASPTVRDGQEMEIVVAQHRYDSIPQCLNKPQNL